MSSFSVTLAILAVGALVAVDGYVILGHTSTNQKVDPQHSSRKNCGPKEATTTTQPTPVTNDDDEDDDTSGEVDIDGDLGLPHIPSDWHWWHLPAHKIPLPVQSRCRNASHGHSIWYYPIRELLHFRNGVAQLPDNDGNINFHGVNHRPAQSWNIDHILEPNTLGHLASHHDSHSNGQLGHWLDNLRRPVAYSGSAGANGDVSNPEEEDTDNDNDDSSEEDVDSTAEESTDNDSSNWIRRD